MKYLIPLLATLTIITGCSLQGNKTLSIDEITQCVSENTLETCQSKCNEDITCEQRVEVIAKENNKTQEQPASSKITRETQENNESQEKIAENEEEKEITENKTKTENTADEEEKTPEQTSDETMKEQIQTPDGAGQAETNGLVTLSGSSCDNKDDLPETMKIFAERVDIKKWDWIVSRGGEWELTDLEPGQYKIYYAPDRNAEPLGKYSEFIADGSANHDYKILDLSNGGEVRNIKPCDWEN